MVKDNSPTIVSQKTSSSSISSMTTESWCSYNLRRSDDMASIGSTATDSEPVHWVEGDGLSIVSKPWCEKTPIPLLTECSSELDRYKSKYLGPSDRSQFGSDWAINLCSGRSYPRFSLEKSNSFSTDRLGCCHRDDGSGKRVCTPQRWVFTSWPEIMVN